ncbi:MAG: glycosyltransferase family 4 protein [Flaviaesturariibacter sp.]|nr:glycosyltransferase family 4 protein [Flaviaesturariibacter sp.]
MDKENYFLWLPSWYPNKIAPIQGDFIQRHAQATAIYEQVEVIFVIRDEKGLVTKTVAHQVEERGNLREHCIYYYVVPKRIKAVERLLSYRKYRALYRGAIKKIFAEKGKPKLVHSYVSLKAGALALWIKAKFGIPYFFSEQWTVYLKEARPNTEELPLYFRRTMRKVIQNASEVSVVSDYLGQRLTSCFGIKSYRLIPNVVNAQVFKPAVKSAQASLQLIHISGLDYQKNAEQILDALAIVKKDFADFTLNIVGPPRPVLQEQVKQLELLQNVFFLPEMPHSELVKHIQQADALVLFSRYETFGCVLIEAHACGLPVIVSDIPVHHENVKEGFNGLFAEDENPASLARRLLEFAQNKQTFDSQAIAAYAHQAYSYERIGKMFKEWYQSSDGA